MRRTIAAAAAILTLGATAVAVGGLGDPGPGTEPAGSERLRAYPVESSGAPAPPRATGTQKPLAVVYRETKPAVSVPQGISSVTVGRCPRGAKIIGGYFYYADPDPKTGNPRRPVVDLGGSPAGSVRKWVFYRGVLEELGGGTGQVDGLVYGIVCAKNAR